MIVANRPDGAAGAGDEGSDAVKPGQKKPGAARSACLAAVLGACAGGLDAAPAWPAQTAAALAQEGYQIAWGGFAAITTCRNGQDRYRIGPYLFVCAEGVNAYPYHFGTVFLVARIVEVDGREVASTYLCLEAETGDDICLPGAVYRR